MRAIASSAASIPTSCCRGSSLRPHGARAVRRRASAVTVAGKAEAPERIIDFPLEELRRLAGVDGRPHRGRARARPSRLLRRRQRRQNMKIAVPSWRPRRRRQGRHRRGGRAHHRRRPRSVDPVRPRRGAAQAGAHADPGAHPQGQARARRARPGRGRHLVVHLQAAGRTVRRRRGPSSRSPIRSRPSSPTCGRA